MDVTISLKCNNDCIFCPRHDYLKIIASVSPGMARKDIRLTRRISDRILLSGGEVTCDRNLIPLLSFCKSEGFSQIGIITNGRKFKDPKFLEDVFCAGVTEFAVSLYSLKPEIHDKITRRPGSCAETQAGLMNLLEASKKRPIRLRVNLVLNYWNRKDIYQTVEELLARGIRIFIISEQIVLSKTDPFLKLEDLKKFLKKMLTMRLEKAHLCLRGFAPCLYPKGLVRGRIKRRAINIKEKDPVLTFEGHDVDTLVKKKDKKTSYLNKFAASFIRVKACACCVFKAQCPGLQKAYVS